jgi:hypothetical protein
MAKILVSLVSDQTIQNLMLMKELVDIDEFLLISTDKMERDGKSVWIENSFNNKSIPIRRIIVDENSVHESLKTFQSKVPSENEYIVNITGGTKLMSIAVYEHFSKINSKIVYIPFGKNHFVTIYPDENKILQNINFRSTIREYLNAYGIQIVSKETNKLVQPDSKYTDSFFKFYTDIKLEDFQVLDGLRKYRGKKKEIDGIISRFLTNSNYPLTFFEEKKELDKYDINYLTGGWFEEWVYNYCKRELNLSESHIALGINILKLNADNEIDVAFTFGNTLHVIECKTAIFETNAESQNRLFNETIYKLAALKKDFGLTVQAYIFTLSSLRDPKGNIAEVYQKRADVLGIKLIDKEILTNQEKLENIFLTIKNK